MRPAWEGRWVGGAGCQAAAAYHGCCARSSPKRQNAPVASITAQARRRHESLRQPVVARMRHGHRHVLLQEPVPVGATFRSARLRPLAHSACAACCGAQRAVPTAETSAVVRGDVPGSPRPLLRTVAASPRAEWTVLGCRRLPVARSLGVRCSLSPMHGPSYRAVDGTLAGHLPYVGDDVDDDARGAG